MSKTKQKFYYIYASEIYYLEISHYALKANFSQDKWILDNENVKS